MKDTVHIKKKKDGFSITRSLEESGLTLEQVNERIKAMEGDIEAYTDAKENLELNKDKILKENADKIDKNIVDYAKAIENLQGNIQAIKSAVALGEGKNSIITKGDTVQGVIQ